MANENDWRQAIPEALRGDESLKDFSDVGSLAKSYVELKGFQGQSIRVPPPEAGPEARKAFIEKLTGKVPELVLVPEDPAKRAEVEEHIYRRLGRPADEKEYKLPEDLPVGVKVDETVLRATGKALGLTQAQFTAFARAHASEVNEALKSHSIADAALKQKWGQAYEERVGIAAQVAGKMGVPPEALKSMSPGQIEVWYNVSQAVGGEGGEGRRQGPGSGGRLAPGEALARAAEIRARQEYWDENAAQHKHLVEEHNKLMEMAYPG